MIVLISHNLNRLSALTVLFTVAVLGIVVFAPISVAQGTLIIVGPNVQVSTPDGNDMHYEVMLAAHPEKAGSLLGGSMISSEANGFTAVAYVSTDGGNHWNPKLKVGRPAEDLDNTDPAVAFGLDNTLYFVSNVRTPGPNVRAFARLYKSNDEGGTWSVLSEFPFFDRPFITVDDSESVTRGTIYVVGKTPNFASGIVEDRVRAIYSVAHSSDRGRTFKYTRIVMPIGVSAPAVVLSDGTSVFLVSEDLGPSEGSRDQPGSNTLLKVISSSDGGETFTKPVVVSRYSLPMSYKMWTSNPVVSLAADRTTRLFKDRLYAVYGGMESSRSQIVLVYSADKGRTWSKPTVVSESSAPTSKGIPRIPFMPVVAVNSEGVVGVSWYDRSESQNGLDFNVCFTASLDGGETFLPRTRISEKAFTHSDTNQWILSGYSSGGGHKSPWVPTFGGGPLRISLSETATSHHYGGQTAGLASDAEGRFHPFWIDNGTGTPQVWTTAVKVNGSATRNGSRDLSDLDDLSEKLALRVETPHFDRASKTLSVDIRIQNISREVIRGVLKAKVISLRSDAIVGLVSSNNAMHGPGAIVDLSSLLEGGQLAPLAISRATKRLEFAVSDWPSLVERLQSAGYGLQVLELELKIFGKSGK